MPGTTSVVRWGIGLTLALYFLQRTVVTAADLQQAFGVDAGATARHWWSIVTYPFVHAGFWELALNLYTLWVFGTRLEARWGSREFLRLAVVCAVGGWIAHMLFVPSGSVLIGSTSVVLGVLLAYARQWPTEEVALFGAWPVQMRWLTFVVALTVLANGVWATESGDGASLAHVGGFVAAWLYLRAVSSVDLDRLRHGVSAVPDLPDDAMPRAVPKSPLRPQDPTYDRSYERPYQRLNERPRSQDAPARVARTRPVTSTANAAAAPTLDTILDKISAMGIESLSSDERAFLDAASRRLREP
jgi:membrane associated rhomboid family serine protease